MAITADSRSKGEIVRRRERRKPTRRRPIVGKRGREMTTWAARMRDGYEQGLGEETEPEPGAIHVCKVHGMRWRGFARFRARAVGSKHHWVATETIPRQESRMAFPGCLRGYSRCCFCLAVSSGCLVFSLRS